MNFMYGSRAGQREEAVIIMAIQKEGSKKSKYRTDRIAYGPGKILKKPGLFLEIVVKKTKKIGIISHHLSGANGTIGPYRIFPESRKLVPIQAIICTRLFPPFFSFHTNFWKLVGVLEVPIGGRKSVFVRCGARK